MSNSYPKAITILETLRANGGDTQDHTLDWNTVAKPAAVSLNITLEKENNIPQSMRGVTYKRFLGVIGSNCLVDMKDSEGNPILNVMTGKPRKHFSSVRFCGMFPKKIKGEELKLLPKFMKTYKTEGLPSLK